MAKSTLILVAAAASSAAAFAPSAGSVPGLRERAGVALLAMSEQNKCEQVRCAL